MSTKSPAPPANQTLAPPPGPRREVISEQDAGTLEPIQPQHEVQYEYVPPMYNPEWAQTSSAGRSVNSGRQAVSVPSSPDPAHHSVYGTAGSSFLGDDGDYPGTPFTMATSYAEERDPLSPSSPTHAYRSNFASYSSAQSPRGTPRSP
jgi:hypothetical protein